MIKKLNNGLFVPFSFAIFVLLFALGFYAKADHLVGDDLSKKDINCSQVPEGHWEFNFDEPSIKFCFEINSKLICSEMPMPEIEKENDGNSG